MRMGDDALDWPAVRMLQRRADLALRRRGNLALADERVAVPAAASCEVAACVPRAHLCRETMLTLVWCLPLFHRYCTHRSSRTSPASALPCFRSFPSPLPLSR